MKDYTLEELSRAEAYEQDPELATFARKVAKAHFLTPEPGVFVKHKADVLAGKHADLVFRAMKDAQTKTLAEKLKKEQGKEKALSLTPPDGYTIEANDKEILIRGKYDADLGERIKRLKGY